MSQITQCGIVGKLRVKRRKECILFAVVFGLRQARTQLHEKAISPKLVRGETIWDFAKRKKRC